MLANVNDKPAEGATCPNCKQDLTALTIDTNKGKQVIYVCGNENSCPRYGLLTTRYNLGAGPVSV